MVFLVTLIILLYPSLSAAQQAVDIETQRTVQFGYGDPSITFKPNVTGNLGVKLRCAGREYSLNSNIKPGLDLNLSFSGLSAGTHSCAGSVKLTSEDGSYGEMPLSLEVQLLPPLELSVSPEHLNIQAKTVQVQGSRPLNRVLVDVKCLDTTASSTTDAPVLVSCGLGESSAQSQSEAQVEWSQSEGEVLQIEITGWDDQNFPGKVVLSPWSYAIPHEDVTFHTGSAIIDDSELPKLEQAYQQLVDILKKYGTVVVVKLYVAGYTDTVGAADANLRLSNQRAASIASWFRSAGFKNAIHYQGFGENALAVPTPNEFEESKNRRAIYLLSADIPPLSHETPQNSWTLLQL